MSDTKEIINCPACGKEMKKIYVESAGCNIDICIDGCGGIFFDNRELKKFDEVNENIDDIIKAYKNKEYKKVGEVYTRICPVCKAKMVKHYASARKEVEIDECYDCGGIFLDYGELEEIRKQYNTEEERKKAFENSFEVIHDIRDFKDYESKNIQELFSAKGFRPIYNKAGAVIVNFVNKLF